MRRALQILITFVYISAATALLPAAAVGQQSTAEIDARTTALYDSVMSPYCPAVTLSACTSPNAKALRDEIRAWVEQGKSDREIQRLLVEQFGGGVLGVPSSSGFGLVGWLAPLAAVLIGLTVLIAILRRMQAEGEAAREERPAPQVDPEMQRRIDAELKRRLVET